MCHGYKATSWLLTENGHCLQVRLRIRKWAYCFSYKLINDQSQRDWLVAHASIASFTNLITIGRKLIHTWPTPWSRSVNVSSYEIWYTFRWASCSGLAVHKMAYPRQNMLARQAITEDEMTVATIINWSFQPFKCRWFTFCQKKKREGRDLVVEFCVGITTFGWARVYSIYSTPDFDARLHIYYFVWSSVTSCASTRVRIWTSRIGCIEGVGNVRVYWCCFVGPLSHGMICGVQNDRIVIDIHPSF